MKIILHIAGTVSDSWRPIVQRYDKSICTVTKSDDKWHISGSICGDISQESDLATDIANYIAISSGYGSVLYSDLPIFEIEAAEGDDVEL